MSNAYAPPDDPLTFLHEDHEIVVLDKPAGLLSVPGRGPDLADCLITRVQAVHPQALLVHRLDRDTSGVMVFALTPHAQRNLSMQFETKRTKKTYQALLDGVLDGRKGEVDLPLIVDWVNRPRQMVCHETGRAALTLWRAMRHEGDTTRIRLFPQTGRTHQLRVHMLAIGHVILGDTIYATGRAAEHPRLMLHAEELRLNHPESGRGMAFRAPVPF